MKKMEPSDFRKWRKALDLSQKEAADALGLKRRMIQYYEKGERNGEDVNIPLTVALACYALSVGVTNYRGPGKKLERQETTGETVKAVQPTELPAPSSAEDPPPQEV